MRIIYFILAFLLANQSFANDPQASCTEKWKSTYSCNLALEHYGSRVVAGVTKYVTHLYGTKVKLEQDINGFNMRKISPSEWKLVSDSTDKIDAKYFQTDFNSIVLWLRGGMRKDDYELFLSKDANGKSYTGGSAEHCSLLDQSGIDCRGKNHSSDILEASLGEQTQISATTHSDANYNRVQIYARCTRTAVKSYKDCESGDED